MSDTHSHSSHSDPHARGAASHAKNDVPGMLPLPRLPKAPFWMIAVALIGIVLTLLPLALIARARISKSLYPRVQIFQDMGVQPKFREQQTNSLFSDDRAMRPRIPGTVSRNDPLGDSAFNFGFTDVYDPYSGVTSRHLVESLPQRYTNNPETLRALIHRGQQRFNIYCYPCHGYDGSGHGPVSERAIELAENGVKGMSWVAAANLTSDVVRAESDGKIFNTISNGIRSMPSYSSQIPTEDRWAIVAYVRALQISSGVPESALTPDQRNQLQNP